MYQLRQAIIIHYLSIHYAEYSKSVPAAGFTETDEETLTAGGLDLGQLKAQ